jgi:hypothetical protein
MKTARAKGLALSMAACPPLPPRSQCGLTSTARQVASRLFRKQVLRIFTTVGVCTRRGPHTLIVGCELAITGIAPRSSLQTIPILYGGRWHGRCSHASAREAWARDRNQASNQEPCE